MGYARPWGGLRPRFELQLHHREFVALSNVLEFIFKMGTMQSPLRGECGAPLCPHIGCSVSAGVEPNGQSPGWAGAPGLHGTGRPLALGPRP